MTEKGEVNKERRKLTRSDLTNGTGGKFTTTHREYQDDDDDDLSKNIIRINKCFIPFNAHVHLLNVWAR